MLEKTQPFPCSISLPKIVFVLICWAGIAKAGCASPMDPLTPTQATIAGHPIFTQRLLQKASGAYLPYPFPRASEGNDIKDPEDHESGLRFSYGKQAEEFPRPAVPQNFYCWLSVRYRFESSYCRLIMLCRRTLETCQDCQVAKHI